MKNRSDRPVIRHLLRIVGGLIACAAAVTAFVCVLRGVGKKLKNLWTNAPTEKNDADDAELNALLDSVSEDEADASVDEEEKEEEELPSDDETEDETAEN